MNVISLGGEIIFIQLVIGKADWFDPTIARKDELFGEREHGENDDRKALRKSYY